MILALDIASQTGWCVGRADAPPRCGSVKLLGEGAADGAVLAAMADWFVDSIDVHKPDKIVYEAPLPHHSSINSAKLAFRLSGIVELICWRRRIDCKPIHVATVRAQVLGNGRAKKPDVEVWYRAQDWPMPYRNGAVDADAIDAAAVWAFATGIRAPGRGK